MRYSFAVWIFVVLLALQSWGQVEEPLSSRWQVLAGVGQTWMAQQTSDGQSYEATSPTAFRLGTRRGAWAFFAEYARDKSSTGASHIQISRTRHEIMLWSRYAFFPTARRLLPYGSLGAGLFWDAVTTSYLENSSSARSAWEPQLGQALGLELRVLDYVSLLAEVRALQARPHNTNPMLGGHVTLEGRF